VALRSFIVAMRRAATPSTSGLGASSQYGFPGFYCQPSLQFDNILSMATGGSSSDAGAEVGAVTRDNSVGLGPALRQAWLGYQLRLDREMDVAGFGGRGFPDGRVLRLCSDPAGSTISAIGRELGITRQGAGKVVGHLLARGYVSVADSATSGREKSVTLTPRGAQYLAAQRKAARKIEARLRAELGAEGFRALDALLGTLGQGAHIRMRTYLGRSSAQVERLE
jgi:DNA-binding MarR family transcriptional regulator